ncbi:MAG: pantoate--beta-alanine ligase [Rikenellaceae bacterium]|jgi:pantoate--beta-alanine ligase|nr:pantoate--beta-alanine ligase [Rikenellaceae bacterium]
MEIKGKITEIRNFLSGRKGVVGFVPTMGALHAGHLALVERCRCECDKVVVSVFVNPAQFDDPADLRNYPRTLDRDCAMLEAAGADLVFAPGATEIYPEPDTRIFDFGPLERVMEGIRRPGHFNGVAQVVSRLFDIVKPDRAYFGEKDFQQLAIIRELVKREGRAIEIVGCPIVRDADGLALSSRNTLLTPEGRAAAQHIYAVLHRAVGKGRSMPVEALKTWATGEIEKEKELNVEYFEVVDAATLQPVASWEAPGVKRVCVAVRDGAIRLIDNVEI